MKLSIGFWQTYKEVPNDATIPSHILMLRAGLIHKAANGIYNYLPMGLRAIQKVEKIIREEHDKANCYELQMSTITPGELWQESGRWDKMGGQMLKMKDSANRDLCYSPTNEEAITDIFRKTVKSYKQLPLTLYQINTKFRDEIRPRYGLMRGREFLMKDAYSFHTDTACMNKTYEVMYNVYQNIFSRLGLKFIAVEADGGAMADGKARTHEFQVLANSGEDRVIHCKKCDYAANIERAETKRFPSTSNSKGDMTVVDTPNKSTIEDVCAFLQVPTENSLKCLLYTAIEGNKSWLVLFVLIGDDTLNEVKIKQVVKCEHLVPATEHEIAQAGLCKGYIGPFGLSDKIAMYVDGEVMIDKGYVAGANQEHKHVTGFVLSRDASAHQIADIRESRAGDQCARCSGEIEEIRGIEVGQVFELGNKYTKAMNVTILDQNGKAVTPYMGCYGIGVTRTVAAAIEQNHDEFGIIWPKEIAPYHIYFAVIAKGEETMHQADAINQQMVNAGFEVVYDERNAGAGFKFKDADLLGLPIRVVLGEKGFLQDGLLEIKVRKTGAELKVPVGELVSTLKRLWAEL